MLKFKTATGSISSANLTNTSFGAPSGSSLWDVSGETDSDALPFGGAGAGGTGAGRVERLRASPGALSRNSSFISSESGFSKANIIFQNISVPLAWPTDEYFGNRRESREFTVQLVLRTAEGREVFSRVRENVTRAVTDVNFDESFVFPFQSPEFCVEVIIYCKRTDENANPNLVQSLSRSLGRSLGHSLKNYLKGVNNTISGASRYYDSKDKILTPAYRKSSRNTIDAEFIENYRNPEKMCALGSAKFRLRNASLSGLTHTYSVEVFSHDAHAYGRSQLLPIYGNICALVLAQPASVIAPLAQGSLDMFFVEGSILLQKMFCVLQGGQLKCYNEDDASDAKDSAPSKNKRAAENTRAASSPALILAIDKHCSIEPTAFPSAFRLRMVEKVSAGAPSTRHILFISESRGSFLGWRNAFALQIADCDVWEDFASALKNPYAAALRLPNFVNSASPTPQISQKITNTSSSRPYHRTPPVQPRSAAENLPRRSRNGRQRAPIVSEYFQTMEKEEIREKRNESADKKDSPKLMKSSLSDINAKNLRMITDDIVKADSKRERQAQINSQMSTRQVRTENEKAKCESPDSAISMQTRNDNDNEDDILCSNGKNVAGKLDKNRNDIKISDISRSAKESSLSTDRQTAEKQQQPNISSDLTEKRQETAKRPTSTSSKHKTTTMVQAATDDKITANSPPTAKNHSGTKDQAAAQTQAKAECQSQLNVVKTEAKLSLQNESNLRTSAPPTPNEVPTSAQTRHFVKKSDYNTVGGKAAAAVRQVPSETTRSGSAATSVRNSVMQESGSRGWRTPLPFEDDSNVPVKPPRRSESVSRRAMDCVELTSGTDKKFVLKIGIVDDKSPTDPNQHHITLTPTSLISHSAAQSSNFVESDTSTTASTASSRQRHNQLPSSPESDKSFSNSRQKMVSDRVKAEGRTSDVNSIVQVGSNNTNPAFQSNLKSSESTKLNGRALDRVSSERGDQVGNRSKANNEADSRNSTWTSSTSSSTSAGRETQTARAIFFDSSSASSKAGSASASSNPTTPMFPPSNLMLGSSNPDNEPTKSDSKVRLKSSVSFAENRRKFEELANSRATNPAQSGERGAENRHRVEERPRHGGTLKKCSSVLFSDLLPYASEHYRANGVTRTPRPESTHTTIMRTFSRDPSNGWHTLTTTAPLGASRNNFFDNAQHFSTFKQSLEEKLAAIAQPKERANTLAYGSYDAHSKASAFGRGIDAKAANRPNILFPSEYRKQAPSLRAETFHRSQSQLLTNLAPTHSTRL